MSSIPLWFVKAVMSGKISLNKNKFEIFSKGEVISCEYGDSIYQDAKGNICCYNEGDYNMILLLGLRKKTYKTLDILNLLPKYTSFDYKYDTDKEEYTVITTEYCNAKTHDLLGILNQMDTPYFAMQGDARFFGFGDNRLQRLSVLSEVDRKGYQFGIDR